jgi:hypothetical protein
MGVAALVEAGDTEGVDLKFSGDGDISERVIFPITLSRSNGIEDAHFVEFADEGSKRYYNTYTAYSGRAIRSELIATADCVSFKMTPLRGDAARNKGMALFPRKIGGRYAMIARQDNENLYLIYSDDLHRWDGGVAILKPQFPWEFVQIGNCGSPIELDEGWLLLTHGVGPVRKYSIGAALFDKHDPSKVIARSREPLLHPDPSEREGYVPNVVYTCGATRHNDQIILPLCDLRYLFELCHDQYRGADGNNGTAASNICGRQEIDALAAACVDPCGYRVNARAQGVKGDEDLGFLGSDGRLHLSQCIVFDDERRFHRAVAAPEAHRAPRSVV